MAAVPFDAVPLLALRLLPLVERLGNLTEAARALDVSQPAASKAIVRAEEICGLALVMRGRRPMALTAEGRILAEHAERQDELARLTARRLDDCRAQGDGLVRIASFGASASTHILPQLVAAVGRRFSRLQIEITENTDQPTLQALHDGRVDFATIVETEDPDLDLLPLKQDHLMALVRTGDPLARRRTLDAPTLAAAPFIMTKGGSEPLVRAWFTRGGHEPMIRHSIQQITSILALVRAGMGVSIIAETAVPETHAGVTVTPLEPSFPRTLCLARRAGSFASHAAEIVWRMAAERAIPR
ncbi:LysR family transcriptional regulator [Xanthobacter autotrophicus]|uniref:LysR family transcriptional regulator n=1 Tax=Xanthobacter autotrophicus TaxID=280 RepID=UPI0037276EE1